MGWVKLMNMSWVWMNINLEQMCKDDDRGEDESKERFVLQDLSV